MFTLVIIEMIFQAFIFFDQLRQLTHGKRTFDQAMHLFAELFQYFTEWHDAFTNSTIQHGCGQSIFIDMQMRQNIRHLNTGIKGIGAVLNRTLQLSF